MKFTVQKDDEVFYTAVLDCPGMMRIHFRTEHLPVLRELVAMLEEMQQYEEQAIAAMEAEEEAISYCSAYCIY